MTPPFVFITSSEFTEKNVLKFEAFLKFWVESVTFITVFSVFIINFDACGWYAAEL